MNKFLLSLIVASSALTAPAFAQHGDHGWNGYRGNAQGNSQPAQQSRPAQAQQQPVQQAPAQARQAPVQNSVPQNQAYRGQAQYQGQQGNWNRGQAPVAVQQPSPAQQNYRQQYNHQWNNGQQHQQQTQWGRGNDGRWQRNGGIFRGNERNERGWNNDWRRDQRYNWQDYRRYNSGYYHLGAYYNPYGYGYDYYPYGVGAYLDDMFFGEEYWINNPYDYRLPPADGPYRWVRYYNDVIMVDIRNGRVVDVIRNFFW